MTASLARRIRNKLSRKLFNKMDIPTIFESLEGRLLMSATLEITEFMASNDKTLVDEDGDSSDWIEIHNASNDPIDLAGWHLTDDAADNTKWTFPSLTLQPDEYLLVFASGKDRINPTSELHTNFNLNANGEYLGLFQPDLIVATEFAPEYPEQEVDVSYGLGQSQSSAPIVGVGDTANILIPTDNSLGTTWTGGNLNEPFDDSSWIGGTNGIGYDTIDTGTGTSQNVFGPSVIDRSSVDSLSGSVFILDTSPITTQGTATSWSFYSTLAGKNLTPLLFQKNASNEFVITGIGQTRVSSDIGLQTYDFNIQLGSDQVGTDYYFGWKDGTPTSNNSGAIDFSSNTGDYIRYFGTKNTISNGDNIDTGSAFARSYSIQVEIETSGTNVPSTTIGNPIIARPTIDTAVGSIFLLENTAFVQPGEILQWKMFSNNTNTITPLIFFRDDFGEYNISAIGQTRTSDASGEQLFDFNIQSGSSTVGPNYFFGWKDGSTTTDNIGVVSFTDGTSDSVRWFGQNTTFANGDNLGSGQAFNRTYSFQAISSIIEESVQPMAYWDFNNDVLDQTTNQFDGIINGATFSNDSPTILPAGQSLTFDGINDFVSVEINVPETEYSVSLWFKTTQSNIGIYGVMDSDLGVGGNDRHLYLTGGNIGVRTWNTETITSSGQNYADGQWHHVVHTLGASAGGQKIYVDGQLVASGTKTSSDFNWQKRINIGFSNDAISPGDHPENFFNGEIDDVSIWDRVLTQEQINQIGQGNSPLLLSGYTPLIRTDLNDEMNGINSSAFVRMPFNLNTLDGVEELRLNMRYDDGFIAYLNGVEIARRNAPVVGTETYNSTATTDRDRLDVINQEIINLTSYVDHLILGENILSFHALNDTIDSPEFLLQAELLTLTNSPNSYMITPTPGGPNAPGVFDFVSDTMFSIDRGLYTDPIDVEITTLTEGATIYYTLDGSIPEPGNTSALIYDSTPIHIDSITTLRAAAYKTGYEPTNVDTHTYIFVADVANQPALPAGMPANWNGIGADYGIDPDVVNNTLPGYSLTDALTDLPTLSIVTEHDNLWSSSTGIYYNSQSREERPASLELIFPDGTTQGFQIDASLRMHGNSSRSHGFTPKHPFRVTFKQEFGPTKLEYKLFEDSDVDRFDQIILRGASTDSWPVVDGGNVLGVQRWRNEDASYIRDQWMRDAQNEMGTASGHGTYVHLYLNGLYWGLYNIAERPTNDFASSYFGGDKDEYDVIKDFAELQDGTKETWNTLMAMAGADLSSDAAYYALQGLNPDGSENPELESYLHMDSFIDYMILHIYAGAEDWQDHNWWASRRRGPESEGFRFFTWDQEISNNSLIRTHTLFQRRFEDPSPAQSPNYIYGQLMANDTFVQIFQDRVQEHLFNGGLLTPEVNHARWMARQTEVDKAMVAESARWGDYRSAVPFTREVEWLEEMNWMRDTYWPEIHEIALERFRRVGLYPNTDAPVFNQNGGQITPDFDIEITAPQGAIYYTLDGTDPIKQDDSPPVITNIFDQTATKTVFIPDAPTEAIATIGTFTGADVGEGLDFDGNFRYAVNVGGNSATIRDANFAQATPGNFPAGVNIEYVNHIPAWIAPNYGNSADDNVLESIVQSILWTPIANGGEVNVHFSDLIVGNEYKMQLMFDEGCCSRGFDVIVQGQLIADEFSPNALEAGNVAIGSYITYEFIATDENLTITLDGSTASFADQNPILQAVTLEELPGGNLNILNWKGGIEPFDDSLWIQGAGGVGYDTEPDFGPHIGIDIETELYTVNPSAYVRIPFTLTPQQAAEMNLLTLNMQFDDGFVAYLNGVRVASMNAPADLRYNSSASSPRDEAFATDFVAYDISDYAQYLKEGDNIFAIHGLNAGASSSDFLINATLDGGVDLESVPSDSAILYTGSFNINQSTKVTTRALSNGEWSGLVHATFLVDDIPGIRVTEIMYNPPAPSQNEIDANFIDNELFEYIELLNISSSPIDLSNITLTEGFDFDFSTSLIQILNPGEYAVIVKNTDAFDFRYGSAAPDGRPINVLGQYDGSLSNGGEQIIISDQFNREIMNFSFEDGDDPGEEAWTTLPDSFGPSLDIVNPNANPATWNSGVSWRASGIDFGTPGRPDPIDGALAGDFNYDGIVNIADLAKLASNFNMNANTNPQLDIRWQHGDTNNDGVINIADLAKLASNFNQSQVFGGASASNVNLIDESTPSNIRSEAILLNIPDDSENSDFAQSWDHIGNLLNEDEQTSLV